VGFITLTPKTDGTDVRLVGDAHPTVCSLDEESEMFVMPDRDYTLIIDKSGSMSTPDQPGGKTRWETVQESTLAVARKCEQLDANGITIYLFSSRFKRYDNVTSDKVTQIFQEKFVVGTLVPEALKRLLQTLFLSDEKASQ